MGDIFFVRVFFCCLFQSVYTKPKAKQESEDGEKRHNNNETKLTQDMLLNDCRAEKMNIKKIEGRLNGEGRSE